MSLLAHYPLDRPGEPGIDIGGNGFHAKVCGSAGVFVRETERRLAASFPGGGYGTGYLSLPAELLSGFSDERGLTVCAWVFAGSGSGYWSRIFDFGKGEKGSYIFLARGLRGVCFAGADLAAVSSLALAKDEWVHLAMTVSGTRGGTLSAAGPRIYVNGALTGDGFISQTSSGAYKMLREFFAAFSGAGKDDCRFYLGHSQFDADGDFAGAMRDVRIYDEPLSEEELLGILCESLSDGQILALAGEKFLHAPRKIVTDSLALQTSLMAGKIAVRWESSNPGVLDETGKIGALAGPEAVTLKAVLSCGEAAAEKVYPLTVLAPGVPAYELEVFGGREVLRISDTLYGLFFEDINRCADGGLYAELVQNRSFENFTYDTYDSRSGENGASTGRIRRPLEYWYGDTDKVTVQDTGGLNEYFGINDADVNSVYLSAPAGTVLSNRGFCGQKGEYALRIREGAEYTFSAYLRGTGAVRVTLKDAEGRAVSKAVRIETTGNPAGAASGSHWERYERKLIPERSAAGQLVLEFEDDLDIDFVSLMPGDVWGVSEEPGSPSAHANFTGNPNYRLRRDLVRALLAMKPRFLRFPGGCISEGSYIWDDVYDWKDSVGDAAARKENFNCWGYTMTMGLGYLEYFQLAEDLGAEPLPVMACGVLCQARSDYANPAGGALREKYIANFTDLIDFAISTDDANPWAALRRDLGHEKPFGLHFLGVGNENWGTEFYANFEIFREAIDRHMEEHYPGYPLTILSTVGAQADDRSYQNGWKFLAGYWNAPEEEIRFTDGKTSWAERVSWYPYRRDHLDTIADEHFYRANDYLLENADRYDYYVRAYREDGTLDEARTPKVFIGEYASSEKNTLAGAVAEAAAMTGFERNSDVVRLAATAPLFNHVTSDGSYRWTPDCIWFDEDRIWYTPTYYVQKLFAEHIGTGLLRTEFSSYEDGELRRLSDAGTVSLRTEGRMLVRSLAVADAETGTELRRFDFTGGSLPEGLLAAGELCGEWTEEGFAGAEGSTNILYVDEELLKKWRRGNADARGNGKGELLPENLTVTARARKLEEDAYLAAGTGVRLERGSYVPERISMKEYCVGAPCSGTGLRVVKDGKEGYAMGDYSDSVYAGNLRACYDEAVPAGEEIAVTVCCRAGEYRAYYTVGEADAPGSADGQTAQGGRETGGKRRGELRFQAAPYNRAVYHSVTADEEYVYLKLVNADEFGKKLSLSLRDLPLAPDDGEGRSADPGQNTGGNIVSMARRYTLTGSEGDFHRPNVNFTEKATVVPREEALEIRDGRAVLDLPAMSVTVVRAKRA